MSIILVGTITIGLLTRFSFHDNLSQENYINNTDLNIEIIPELNGAFQDDKINNLDDLISSADIIIKASVPPNTPRENKTDMTISTLTVKQVYKGNLKSDTLSVMEPIYYFSDGDYIASIDGYYWMQYETDYILFLTELKDAHWGNDKNIYLPTTTRYSKYNIANADDIKNTIPGYSDYIKLRDDVLNEYNQNK